MIVNSYITTLSQSSNYINSKLLSESAYQTLLGIYLKRRLCELPSIQAKANDTGTTIETIKTEINDMVDSMNLNIYVALRIYAVQEGKNLCNLLIEDISWNLYYRSYNKVSLKEIENIVYSFYNKYESE